MEQTTCDPSPLPFHRSVLWRGNGQIKLDIEWGWDGVSVPPVCDGPVLNVRVRNLGTEVWYAHITTRQGPRSIQINPGADRYLTPAQRAAASLDTYADVRDVALDQVP